MKKSTLGKKFFAWTMALVTVGSLFCASGCKKKETVAPQKQSRYDLSNCVHIYDVTDGSQSLVVNGKCNYTIVYPEKQKTDKYILNCISELKMFFKEATGLMLQAKTDAEFTGTDKILSIGATNQAMSKTAVTKALKSAELGDDGFVIESEGSAVYMLGNTTEAALYGVYEFLKWQFDFEFYADGVYTLMRDVTDMNLKNYHVVDVPDFQTRASNVAGIGKLSDTVQTRMRYEDSSDGFVGGEFVHNFMDLLPSDKYGEHNEWYSDAGGNLCLTAHGNAESLELMVEAVTNEYIARFTADSTCDWAVFSPEDGTAWCTCSACTKEIVLFDHGMQTAAWATSARFINKVAKKLKVWNETNCPERDLTIFLYDYGNVQYAPVKMDEKRKPIVDAEGNYQPYSEDVVLEDNVGVFMCSLRYATAYKLEEDAPANVLDEERMGRAFACMKEPQVMWWMYSALFGDYMVPLHTIDTRQDYYQYVKSCNAMGVMDQGQHDNNYATDWGCLKQYISAKLMWNTQLNVQELIANFMKAYFGEASGVMMEMYEAYRAYMMYIRDELGVVGSVNQGPAYRNKKYFPYGIVQNFLGYIERAHKALEPIKNKDASLYEKLQTRVIRESITWRYLDFILYSEYYSTEQLKVVQNAWLNDAMDAGIVSKSERSDISTIFG